MVNVNGWDVMIDTRVPEHVARGWLFRSDVYLVDDGSKLGSVCELRTRRDPNAGREVAHWIDLPSMRFIDNGNINDLVAAAILRREGQEPFAPPTAD